MPRSKETRHAAQAAGISAVGLSAPGNIPCKKGHTHLWPIAGPITMEDVGRCQVHCQFCAAKGILTEAKFPWYLRRHIWDMHRQELPQLQVPPQWSGKKQYSKGKTGPTPSGKTTKRTKKTALRAQKTVDAAPQCNTPSLEQAIGSGAVTPAGRFDINEFDFGSPVQTDVPTLSATDFTGTAMESNYAATDQLMSSESGLCDYDFDNEAFLAGSGAWIGELAPQTNDPFPAGSFSDDSGFDELMQYESDQSDPFVFGGSDPTLPSISMDELDVLLGLD